MSDCAHHAGAASAAACAACGTPCCDACLVRLRGLPFCEACKYAQVRPELVPPAARSRAAWKAVRLAAVGLVFAGVVVEPIAVVQALRVRRRIRRDPAVGGEGVADAALLVALCGFALWTYGVLVRLVLP